jgi:hypothetical protein
MRYADQKLEGLTLHLDDDEIVGCHLIDCQILFGGKRLPVFSGNRSDRCHFHFSESALITIEVLRRMLRIPGLRELVLAELGLVPSDAQTIH